MFDICLERQIQNPPFGPLFVIRWRSQVVPTTGGGSRSLRDKVEDKRVLVCSTGATEKNIDIVIGRRFKRLGQSWTTEGANNLVKLRTLLL
jgi:hypothetical protein